MVHIQKVIVVMLVEKAAKPVEFPFRMDKRSFDCRKGEREREAWRESTAVFSVRFHPGTVTHRQEFLKWDGIISGLHTRTSCLNFILQPNNILPSRCGSKFFKFNNTQP
jgi:hypothetical protein